MEDFAFYKMRIKTKKSPKPLKIEQLLKNMWIFFAERWQIVIFILIVLKPEKVLVKIFLIWHAFVHRKHGNVNHICYNMKWIKQKSAKNIQYILKSISRTWTPDVSDYIEVLVMWSSPPNTNNANIFAHKQSVFQVLICIIHIIHINLIHFKLFHVISYSGSWFRFNCTNQFTYDYVKLKIGYFSNRIPVWEGIFTLENLT